MSKLTKAKPARGKALGILNPYGDLWTFETFQTEALALAYVKRFWTNSAGMVPAGVRISDFKTAPVRVTVSVIHPRVKAPLNPSRDPGRPSS